MDNRYQPLSKQDFDFIWDKHRMFIENFISSNGYDANNIYVNEDIIMAIIAKVDQRRKYFNYFHKLEMSEYKETALNSFWYIKLHPLSIGPREFNKHPSSEYESINEKLALYFILKTLKVMLIAKKLPTEKLDNIPTEYLDELVYTLTYRDISKESLIILVESMAVFLGLNPYASNEGISKN